MRSGLGEYPIRILVAVGVGGLAAWLVRRFVICAGTAVYLTRKQIRDEEFRRRIESAAELARRFR